MSEQSKIPTLQELDHILQEAEAALLQVHVNGELIAVDPEGYDEHHGTVFVSLRDSHHHVKEVREVTHNSYLCVSDEGKTLRISFKPIAADMPLPVVQTMIAEAKAR